MALYANEKINFDLNAMSASALVDYVANVAALIAGNAHNGKVLFI